MARTYFESTKWKYSTNHHEFGNQLAPLEAAGSKVYPFKSDEDAWSMLKCFLPQIEQSKPVDIGKVFAAVRITTQRWRRPDTSVSIPPTPGKETPFSVDGFRCEYPPPLDCWAFVDWVQKWSPVSSVCAREVVSAIPFGSVGRNSSLLACAG